MAKRRAIVNTVPEKKIKQEGNLITSYFNIKPESSSNSERKHEDFQKHSANIDILASNNLHSGSKLYSQNISSSEFRQAPDSTVRKMNCNLNTNKKPRSISKNNKTPQNSKVMQDANEDENKDKDEDYIKWGQAKTPDSKSKPAKTSESISDTFYLRFFTTIYQDMAVYKEAVFSSSDQNIIDCFESLNEPAKLLYVRLFKRKSQWININRINYSEIPNVLQSFQDLLSASLARSSASAFALDSTQLTYDFLSSLTIPLLISIEEHLRRLLAELFDTDSVEIQIEKPWCRALYYHTRHTIFTEEVSRIARDIGVAEIEVEMESRKHLLIQVVMEILLYLNQNIIGKSREELSEMLIPGDFPAFIKLEDSSRSLFSRLHHAYSFYSSENLLSDYGEHMSKGLFPSVYSTSVLSYPLYSNYNDSILCESIYNLCLLLENLPIYHYSPRANYIIAKGVALLRLDSHMSLEEFIRDYSNVESGDWKLEYSAEAKWARALHLCIDFVQREKDWDLAVRILVRLLSGRWYCNKRGHWWERLIVIVRAHLGLKELAEELGKIALTDPFVRTGKRFKLEMEANKMQGYLRNSRQNKFFDYFHEMYREVYVKAESVSNKGRLRFIYENQAISVEEYALEQYKLQGWQGFHSENVLLTSIYGVLMWDFIFYDKIPYVFQNSYQKYPLDYKSDEFFPKRIEIFNSIITKVRVCEDIGLFFLEKYENHYKQLSAFANWTVMDSWGKEFLKNAVVKLRPALIEILTVLGSDYRHYCSGMPDLILMNSTEIKFSEVKSTNDKLSDQQKMWIRLLTTAGCKVEVYHVSSN